MNWHTDINPIRFSTRVLISRQDARTLLRRFVGDQTGSYIILSALLMPVLVGAAGLGTEAGVWYYKHKNMQSAADSGAVSAATAGSNLTAEANAITASYGYANGVSNVAVAVNQPPRTGNYGSNPQAIEVIVSQPQRRLLSALFGTAPVLIKARAVALPNAGTGCVLALNSSASPAVKASGGNDLNLVNCNLYSNSSASPSLDVSGSATVKANQVGVVGDISGASNITATNGIRTHIRPIADPYADVTPPAEPSCDNKKYTVNANVRGFDASAISTAVTSATNATAVTANPSPTKFCGCTTGSSISNVACGTTCPGGAMAGTYATVSAQASYSTILNYRVVPVSYTFNAQSTVRLQ